MQTETSWVAEPDGVLATEIDGLRLVVRPPTEIDGFARFMVLRRVDCGAKKLFTLVASGSEDSVREAMRAAERMAGSYRWAGYDRPSPVPRSLPELFPVRA